jgi:hypothetical protein
MKTKIYIVNGFPGSGKTTFEQMAIEFLPFGKILSTVTFVKEIAIACGWDGTKTPQNRKFLSDLKDLLTQWNDVPFKKIKEIIDYYNITYIPHAGYVILFIDVREPDEIKRYCETYGAKSIYIKRQIDQNSILNHADREVENYCYDYIIHNDGSLYDLAQKTLNFLHQENLQVLEREIGLDGTIK